MNHEWSAEAHRAMGEIHDSAPPAPDLDVGLQLGIAAPRIRRRRSIGAATVLVMCCVALLAYIRTSDTARVAPPRQQPAAQEGGEGATSTGALPGIAGTDAGSEALPRDYVGELPPIAGVLDEPLPYAAIPDVPPPGIAITDATPEYRAADVDGDGFLSNAELIPGVLGYVTMNISDGTTVRVDIAMYAKYRASARHGDGGSSPPTPGSSIQTDLAPSLNSDGT